jgi:hypothetical protein
MAEEEAAVDKAEVAIEAEVEGEANDRKFSTKGSNLDNSTASIDSPFSIHEIECHGFVLPKNEYTKGQRFYQFIIYSPWG